MDHFELLDEGILLKVLGCILDEHDRRSWRLVCKRFIQLETGSRSKIRLLRVELLAEVLRKFESLKDLDLSLCSKITDTDVTTVARCSGARLLAIHLRKQVCVTSVGLAILTSHCSFLEFLDLSGCKNVGDSGVAAIAKARHLQVLKLGGCSSVSDTGLRCITLGCRKLKHLGLKYCKQITDLGMSMLASNCASLEELDLSFTNVSDNGVEYIAGIESLKALNLKACRRIGDKGLFHLAKATTHLLELDVCRSNVTVTGLSTFISKERSSFRVLRLDGCQVSEIVLKLLSTSCKHLVEVSLSKCSGVTDAGVTQVVTSCTGLRRFDLTCCKELTYRTVLSIVKSSQWLFSLSAEGCNIFTPENLLLLSERCGFLEEMDLTDCNITDAGLKSISKRKSLKVLKLGVCSSITNVGLKYIGGSCGQLKELDLYRCDGIADGGISAIARDCCKLRVLNISYCDKLSDASVSFILSSLKELCQLEIRGCSLVTLSKITASCERLLELDVKHCRRVGDAGTVAIVQSCSNLRQINLSYTSVGSVGLAALSKLSCMQNMKLLGLRLFLADSTASMLSHCRSIKKVKLPIQFKKAIPDSLVDATRDRGCIFRWMDKPL